MKILAIETATEACSAALLIDDKMIDRFEIAPREHTKRLLPMMDDVLEEGGCRLADVDAIAFSRGPGAFTGLRIAAGVAQGAALSVDKLVIPVSTLATLALDIVDTQQTIKDATIIATLDARMGEIYWGIFTYQQGQLTPIEEESVTTPEDMLSRLRQLETIEQAYIGGSGWDAYQHEFSQESVKSTLIPVEQVYPTAINVARLAKMHFLAGDAVPAEDAQPVYIRNNVAKKAQNK